MKLLLNSFAVFLALAAMSASVSASDAMLNRIEGIVYSPSRVPLNDVRVELQNEVGGLLMTDKTRSGGRFSFVGVSSGKFLIRVLPVGMDYLDETVTVNVESFARNGGNSGDTEYVDIYLRKDQRRSRVTPKGPPEVVFVQEVPEDAKRLLESGHNMLARGDRGGIKELEKAVAAFPDYFDALLELGLSYMTSKEYSLAYPYFLKAIDVNQRSVTAYYNLGLSLYYLNQREGALKAADAAIVLSSNFAEAHLLRGTVLRLLAKYPEAETELKKAASLAETPNPEINWQLALVYNKMERNEEAALQLEQYLRISPNTADRKKVQDLIDKLRKGKKTS